MSLNEMWQRQSLFIDWQLHSKTLASASLCNHWIWKRERKGVGQRGKLGYTLHEGTYLEPRAEPLQPQTCEDHCRACLSKRHAEIPSHWRTHFTQTCGSQAVSDRDCGFPGVASTTGWIGAITGTPFMRKAPTSTKATRISLLFGTARAPSWMG